MSLTSGEGAVPFTMPVQPAYSGNGGNNNGGMFGDNGWWVIVLFLIWGMWGGYGGFGGFGGGNNAGLQGTLTRNDLCQDMNFQEVKREIQNANDAVNLGFSNLNSTICNQQYDTARMINGLQGTVQAGFNASNIAQLQGQNALQTQISQCLKKIVEKVKSVFTDFSFTTVGTCAA